MSCEKLIHRYISYITKNLIIERKNSICLIELPFPKPDGDSIVLSIKEKDRKYIISDRGFISSYLNSFGLDLWDLPQKAKDIFKEIQKRYDIERQYSPEIVIISRRKRIERKLFQMSNILSELIALKLLNQPVQFDYFKQKINLTFLNNKLEYERDPTINFKINHLDYSFQLDFLFYDKDIYIKTIPNKRRIRHWALNFIKINNYSKNENKAWKLWVIYDDKDNIEQEDINKWFEPKSFYKAFGWNRQNTEIIKRLR